MWMDVKLARCAIDQNIEVRAIIRAKHEVELASNLIFVSMLRLEDEHGSAYAIQDKDTISDRCSAQGKVKNLFDVDWQMPRR